MNKGGCLVKFGRKALNNRIRTIVIAINIESSTLKGVPNSQLEIKKLKKKQQKTCLSSFSDSDLMTTASPVELNALIRLTAFIDDRRFPPHV